MVSDFCFYNIWSYSWCVCVCVVQVLLYRDIWEISVVPMRKTAYKGLGDIIYRLYSIQIIMSMECSHKTWKCMCVCVCVCTEVTAAAEL